MASTIILKNSGSSGKIPNITDLVLGEIALNTADGKIFMKNNSDAIVTIGVSSSDIRNQVSASGDLAYDNQTGIFSYTKQTAGDIRSIFSSSGDLAYDNQTGVFSYSKQTPNELLTAINQVDGAGSELNADKLDGKHESDFATAAQGIKADNALSTTGKAADSNLLDGIDSTGFATAAQGTKADNAIPISEKNVINGVPTLDGNGHILSSQIPAIAIVDVFEESSEAAMLGLTTAGVGDICIRSDESKTYMLSTADPSVLANWRQLLSPNAVQSVDGLTGTISLSSTYLGFNAKATDSDKLDGLDSTAFLGSTATATNSALFDGQARSTFNQVIGTDTNLDTTGSTIIDNIFVTDGVITSMGTRVLTPAAIGALSTTGKATDSSKLNGAVESSAAGNNTIVKRSAQGYVYANYFNNAGAADTGSTPSHVMVEQSSDGFIRPQTLGTFVGKLPYAASTVGGTLKARLSGTTLYLSNNGVNP